MNWPRNDILRDDPARRKARDVGSAAYMERVRSYNASLYAPQDTNTQAPTMPGIAPLSTSSGWQMGDPMAIASRYGTPGARAMMAAEQSQVRTPQTGAAGPIVDTGDAYPYSLPPSPLQSGAFTAQMPQKPAASTAPDWFQKQLGNASQRWREMGSNPAHNGPQGRMAGESEGGSTERYYQRKQARDMQLSTRNPAARDYYRRQRNTGFEPYE